MITLVMTGPIETHIKNLRKKLQAFGLEAAIILVCMVGYRFQIPN